MITQFVNRADELDFLESKYKNEKAQFIVIYGRRRVGKTETILKFSVDKPHVYFLASKVSGNEQIKQVIESVYDAIQDKAIFDLKPEWETIFKYLSNLNERFIIAIDEFPYLIEADKSIPSLFQRAWDLYLKNSKIFLILSGSSISMMENEVLGFKSPLYGRRTGQWMIEELKFKDALGFFPNYSFKDKIAVYGILGGIPFYLQEFDDGKNIEGNIKEKILKKGEILYEEPYFLLREELREPRIYFTILGAISKGNSKFGDIMNASGLDRNTITRYLSILESLRWIRKDLPVTELKSSKKGLYKINDHFFNFWFRFVLPNLSKIEENADNAFDERIKPSLNEYISRVFEGVCREFLIDLNKQNKLPFKFSRIGSWWHKENEIDLVALNEDTEEILFAECKWQEVPVKTKVIEQLIEKSGLVNWRKQRNEYFMVISKSGFTGESKEFMKDKGILYLDLTDIEKFYSNLRRFREIKMSQ